MKYSLIALMMSLGLTTTAFSSDLNERALRALLATQNLAITGDVHSYETLESIYNGAVEANATIVNECHAINSKVAKCILWLTFKSLGETALQYEVLLPGDKIYSSVIDVSRGD